MSRPVIALSIGLDSYLIASLNSEANLGKQIVDYFEASGLTITWKLGVSIVICCSSDLESNSITVKTYRRPGGNTFKITFYGEDVKYVNRNAALGDFCDEESVANLELLLEDNSYCLKWKQAKVAVEFNDEARVLVQITPKSIKWKEIKDGDDETAAIQCAVHSGSTISEIVRLCCYGNSWVEDLRANLAISEYTLYFSRGMNESGIEEFSIVDMSSLDYANNESLTFRVSAARFQLNACSSNKEVDEFEKVKCLVNMQFHAFKNEKPPEFHLDMNTSVETLQKSFEARLTSKGEAVRERLLNFVKSCSGLCCDDNESIFAPITSICQSSGTGKSRMAVELSRLAGTVLCVSEAD